MVFDNNEEFVFQDVRLKCYLETRSNSFEEQCLQILLSSGTLLWLNIICK